MDFNSPLPLTAVVAVEDSTKKLRPCLLALSPWTRIVVAVRPELEAEAQNAAEGLEHRRIVHASRDVRDLWTAGLRQTETAWVLLLRGNEVITGKLKRTIWEKVSPRVTVSRIFPLPRKTVFLQKRLKYPLARTGEFPSSLACMESGGRRGLENIPISHHRFEGELIHYGAETLSEAWSAAAGRANQRASKMHASRPRLSGISLCLSAVTDSLRDFLRLYVIRKGFKEKFEGLAFAFLEAVTAILAHGRYQEKYTRSGFEIRNRLGSVQKVLVIKLRELGDNVLSTPFFRNLKRHLPEAGLTVLTYEYSRPILEENPYIDRLLGMQKNPSRNERNRWIRELNAEGFDLVFNLHAGKLSTSLLNPLQAGCKINNTYLGTNKHSGVIVPESDYYRSAIERELDCLRSLDLQVSNGGTELFLTAEEIKRAEEYLAKCGFDPEKKLVVIHPTASVQTREWGMERYGRLIGKITAEEDFEVLVTCSEAEKSQVESLYRFAPLLTVFTGPIRELMGIIQRSHLVVDNDSAPSHIATALKVPAITLCSSNIREIFRDYNVERHRHHLFYKHVPCRECDLTYCDNKICLEFTVEEVFAKVREMAAVTHSAGKA